MPLESDTLVDPENMRQAMRHWATGVTVVTSCHDGEQHGMTVSSFTSISLTPALVLVSLQEDTRTHELVRRSGIFGVTILDCSQAGISERFAGRTSEDQDRFQGLSTFNLLTGAPLLLEGLAWFDCKVLFSFEAGDHTLFIGNVLALQVGDGGEPLVYFNRDYWTLKNPE